MYLKSLEITGFKSFSDKINIDFTHNFTSVVGPNGSGKSNILDAIRFVLGEQSAKILRGSKMDDVIFMGSSTKKATGFCKVSIKFDNSENILNSEHTEVVISRKLYKTGESEYSINGKEQRLRDVLALFMDTGLSKDGYSIISQGKIDNILSQKSTDRREFFDEATGITKFKYKKDESAKQIEKTNQNILRIYDILEEKEKRLEPLKEQAKKANEYNKFSEELKQNEISKSRIDILQFEKTIKEQKIALNDCKEQISDLRIDYNKKNLDISKLNIAIQDIEKQISELNEEILRKYQEFLEKKSHISIINSDISHLESEKLRISSEVCAMEREISDIHIKINEANSQNDAKKQNILVLDSQKEQVLQEKNEILKDLQNINLKIEENKLNRAKISNEIYKKDLDVKKTESEIKFVLNIIESMSGLPKSVEAVLKNKSLNGVHKTVGDVLKVPEKYILAINSALSGILNNIIVDSSDDAIKAINYLKQNKLGTATFLPLERIKYRENIRYREQKGIIGIASDLVSVPTLYENIKQNFLCNILVCDTAENAKKLDINMKIVTLEGEVFYKGGAISGGFNKNASSSLLNRKKIFELERRKSEELSQKKTLQNELLKLDESIKNEDLQTKIAKINEKSSNLSLKISQFESKIYSEREFIKNHNSDFFNGEIKVREQKIDEILLKNTSIDGNIKAKSDEILLIEKQIKSYDENKLKLKIEELNTFKSAKQEEIGAKNKEIELLTDKRIVLERNLVNFENKIDNLYTKQEDILAKLWEKYGLTYSTVLESDILDESYEVLSQNVVRLTSKINSLGHVNLDAPQEYEELFGEYEFLNGQKDDLEHSKAEIEKMIEKITREMKKIFLEEFFKLNETFKVVFCDLFSGGNAFLELSDPDNPLNSGIEIKVNPPGKSLKSLSLLSGGERAFVATAILFSILKCRKTPFCILDEIDAALDDFNVNKFAHYLRNHSKDTQFIVITHRKGTMKLSDVLYGVTMEQKGVSKILKIHLEN